MICSGCGAEAAVALATGGVQERLCLACAERQAGVPGLAGLARAMAGSPAPGGVCPYCGTTSEQAKRTALAGCPLCYTALAEVWPLLGAMPGRYAQGRGD